MGMDISQVLLNLQQMFLNFFYNSPHIIVGIALFILFYLLGKSLRLIIIHATKRYHRQKSVGVALGRLSQTSILILGLLIAWMVMFPSFKPSSLVQLIGLGGVALGFIFRDILQNYLAGILLLISQPFRIGDQIEVKDYKGLVEEIQTRATYIRTYDGRRVVIPNADLYSNFVTVNTAYDKRRCEHDITIGYGDDIEETRLLILETLRELGSILPSPEPEVLIVDLLSDAVKLRLRWWISPPFRVEANYSISEVLTQIKKTLRDNGIDIPFGTYQVLFHDQTEETDGSRGLQREGWPAPLDIEKRPRAQRIVDELHEMTETLNKTNDALKQILNKS